MEYSNENILFESINKKDSFRKEIKTPYITKSNSLLSIAKIRDYNLSD